jgi:hypothetical protein
MESLYPAVVDAMTSALYVDQIILLGYHPLYVSMRRYYLFYQANSGFGVQRRASKVFYNVGAELAPLKHNATSNGLLGVSVLVNSHEKLIVWIQSVFTP